MNSIKSNIWKGRFYVILFVLFVSKDKTILKESLTSTWFRTGIVIALM